jgi:hypothetical protein
VDIHFVCSFCLFSVTILQYLIPLLQCTQTDRHTDRQTVVGDDDDGSDGEKESGRYWDKVLPITNIVVRHGWTLFNQLPAIFGSLLLYCIYLPDCENIVHRSISRESWWHSSIILLSFSLYLFLYTGNAMILQVDRQRREREQKKINVCIYMCVCIGGIGACGIENKRFLFSPIECIYKGVMTTMNIAYGFISMK